MSKAQDIFNLLVQREGTWVSRDDINFVGGEAADRRMRELREQIARTGQHRLDERRDGMYRLEYRLVKINLMPGTDTQRYQWECTTCASHPATYEGTSATLDPRWRLGTCLHCRGKRGTFRQVVRA